jgi:peptidoglycan-N-acetylglucosamine deacetylase
MPRRCALSVDLDEIHHYHRIHGLPPPSARSAVLVYEVALERALEFARSAGAPLTLFAVASDLERGENDARLRAALAAGHEIASHSKDHLYDLVLRSREEQREQIEGAQRIFEVRLGTRAVGFRAPGYTVSDGLLRLVGEAGHRYDSSVFPCPPYLAAKAAAMALMRLRGRRSGAIAPDLSVLKAPRRPYRIGASYTSEGDGLLELPIQVTRGPRLPYIGTGLVMAGALGARALTELVVGEDFVNLELHGIDFLDATDGLERLSGHQPDVRVKIAQKRRIFSAAVARFREAGYDFVRLRDVPS